MSGFMKVRTIAYLCAILLITLLCLWFLTLLTAIPPVLSHTSGFYEDDFLLTITAQAGAEIYYTLDGSVPDRNSLRYEEPLLITDSSQNPNVYSMRTDVSAGFRSDLIHRCRTHEEDSPEFKSDVLSEYTITEDEFPQYTAPDFLVDKCTIIRAVAINRAGVASELVSASFFVGISPEDYDGCKILSLITDPDNLFSSSKGIYVTGDTFEEYIKQDELGPYWRFWDANYRQRGDEWERDAMFHFFDESGQLVLSKEGAIRVHGGVSRGTLPRSLNLYAREESDRSSTFGVCLFGNDYDPQAVTLSSGGNQLITQFNDYMMTQRVRSRNMSTMLFEPYVLFLDGEYWGFYWMSEKFDGSYLSHYYGVNEDNCVIIKRHAVEVGRESDLGLYEEMVNFISDNDMAVPENFSRASELIDLDSYLDYYCTMIYIARTDDWPGGNTALWRSRIAADSPYADTKWRWMLYDCNSASMRDDWELTEHDTLSDVLSVDSVFASLWNNADFREQFYERLLEIAHECFDPEEMNRFIQEYTVEMEPILAKSWARFYGSQNSKQKEYLDTMESLRTFFLNRRGCIDSWILEGN